MNKLFINTIKSLADVPSNQIDGILKISKNKAIKKGEYFIRAGHIPKQFGFNLKGLFRYYYIDSNGNDFTKGFIPEKNFVSSYSAMILNRESFFWIEALEDSNLLLIQYKDWQKLMAEHISWNILLNKIIEQAYIKKENREKEFLLDNAETRYKNFLKEYPFLEGRVQQYLIASYLGITPVALSRIKKKLNQLT